MKGAADMPEKDVYENDFWDLGKLLAEKRAKFSEEGKISAAPPSEARRSEPERKITLTKITDGYKDPDAGKNIYYSAQRIAPVSVADVSDTVLAQSQSRLILDVKLTRAGGSPRTFTRNAEKYWDADAPNTPFVDFYAYSPTYANFNMQTFKYYLWWRSNFRRGTAIKISWPYLSVYISELINCPHLVSESECIKRLWQLFGAYADVNSQYYLSDVLLKLPEIICDYSLIHSIGIPPSVSEETLLLAVKNARLREVFFESGNDELFCKLLISSCSEYEFAKSKFASDIVNEENEKYIKLAILECIEKAKNDGLDHPLAGNIKEVTTVSRHSYSNYVYIDPEYLYVITVKYCSVNRSYTLRNSISGIVKQCENNLRALSGIKPRLKVFSLEPIFRDTVDRYFERVFPPEKRKKTVKRVKPEEIPEYEKYYEPEKAHEFSLDNARRIEEKSWNVVEKLVEAMESDSAPTEEKSLPDTSKKTDTPPPAPQETSEEVKEDNFATEELYEILSACPECRDFLLAISNSDIPAAKRAAREKGIPITVLADTVNAAAFDVIGDILIDTDGDTLRIISDYEYIFCKNG